MTKDMTKGITSITYNSLNLPRRMDIKSPVAEARNDYVYSAGGQKLKVVKKWNPNYSTGPVIGSAINTGSLTASKTTDYVGNKIYENGALKRILVDGGYIEGGVYHFFMTDHLGNNRVVVNASGAVVQRNHYYPFGSTFGEIPNAEQGKQSYKYNGKELDRMHGLNLYDYSARYYEPALGRFTSVDPMAEKYYSISPYAYCANNPLKFIDPDGKQIGMPINPINYQQMAASQQLQQRPLSAAKVIANCASAVVSAFSSVSQNRGSIRIGSNGKVYLPTVKGNVFKGNQYVSTKSLSSVAKGVGKLSPPASIVAGAIEVAEGIQKDGGEIGDNTQAAASAGGGFAGAAAGGKVGAIAGSVFPGVGNAIGGIVGAVAGGIVGAVKGSDVGEAVYKEIKSDVTTPKEIKIEDINKNK